jgi:hypothetical protein
MRICWLIGDRMVDSFLFVGPIADTHGMMRPEALDALQKADLIIHAGDIGKLAVLERLQTLAPVHAIRGNNDRDPWALTLLTHDTVKIGAHTLYVLHDLKELALDPREPGFSVSSQAIPISPRSEHLTRFPSSIRAALDRVVSPFP